MLQAYVVCEGLTSGSTSILSLIFNLTALRSKFEIILSLQLKLIFNCLFVKYIALHTALQADEIEIYLVKELHTKLNPPTSANSPTSNPSVIDLGKDKLQVLNEQETLAGLRTQNFSQGQLVSSQPD